MALIESLAIEGGKALIGSVAGMGLTGYNDQRQIEQQKRLNELQIRGNKELAKYGQELALDTWEKTNYAEQKRQLQKAGLNVGLMYSQGGPGGTTQHGTAGQVAGAMAPAGGNELTSGIGLTLQQALQKAQIENIQADTAVKQKDAGVKGEEVKLKGQQTENLKAELQKIGVETQIAEMTKGMTEMQRCFQI